jgi:hypothetical protein
VIRFVDGVGSGRNIDTLGLRHHGIGVSVYNSMYCEKHQGNGYRCVGGGAENYYYLKKK